MEQLDRIDRALLAELQRDARQTVQQLAERVGLSATPCWKRIKAMETAGVIRGYTVQVDREQVGLAQCVIVEVNLQRHTEEVVRQFEQAVLDCPAIVNCWSTTGAADYLLEVLVPDIRAYEQFLHATAFKLPGVTHVRSAVVLKAVKDNAPLPVDDAGRPAPAALAARAPRRPRG